MQSYFVFYILSFIFGTIIGSFLNVVIYRYNTGKTLGGRSMCMSCGHTLSISELVPMFSFLFQGGKCKNCHSRFSSQYFWVEFITGIVFAFITWKILSITILLDFSFLLFLLFYFVFFSILIVISVYDIKHQIIPFGLILLLFALYLFVVLYFGLDVYRILGALAVASPFLFLFFISTGRWIGLGDAKLIFAIALFFPVYQSIAILLLSFWIGAIFSIILLLLPNQKVTIKTEIPFGPFIVIATFLSFIFSIDIFSIFKIFGL